MSVFQVSGTGSDGIVCVMDRGLSELALHRARTVLWQRSDCSMTIDSFRQDYQRQFGQQPDMNILTSDMENILTVSTVEIVPIVQQIVGSYADCAANTVLYISH